MTWLFDMCKFFWEKYFGKLLSRKSFALFSVIGLFLSTLPLLILGFYNHPSADDFNYTILTGAALRNNSGIAAFFAVIGAAIERATSYWGVWQGTYAMSFFAALRPSLFSEQLTFLHSVILIGILIISIFYLYHVLLCKILGMDKYIYMILASATAFLSIQYLPNAVEGFFWYTGGVGYTFFLYLAFILLGKSLLAFHYKKLSIPNTIALCILSFCVAGGHFAITLLGFVCTVILFIGSILDKSLSKSFKIRYWINTVIYLVGFALCVGAPGNLRRQASFTEKQTVIETIIKSYLHGLGYAKLYTNTVVFLGILFIGIIAFIGLKKVTFQFKYPVIFTLITFSMYAVLLMPGYYSTNGIPAPRYLDIIYFGVILFFSANIIYYAGWLQKKLAKLEDNENFGSLLVCLRPIAGNVVIFLFILYGLVHLTTLEISLSTGVRAIKSITSGEAAEFDAQMDAREVLYNDDTVKEVSIPALTVYPELIYFDDITDDKDNYANYKIAEYYDKDFIVIE
ncbi:DUF6056 family protein [Konateibacter massiliensis]|uniref:DUF6056 family protein n=1 Tax=Konateibacter massiliensis TaxID=2002841 RepID=UPI000C153734|nr:DUF6056 family protein [Konateibacter massiliensis]